MVPAWTLKSQQSTHKSFAPEFRIFSALKINFMWTGGFHKYKDLYTYRRHKFKNILERKLSNCFGQLQVTYLMKMVNINLNLMLTVFIEFVYIRHS